MVVRPVWEQKAFSWLFICVWFGNPIPDMLPSAEALNPSEKPSETLDLINDITTGSRGSLCITQDSHYRSVPVPLHMDLLFDAPRQKADMMATFLQEIGLVNRPAKLLGAVIENLLKADKKMQVVRLLVFKPPPGQRYNQGTLVYAGEGSQPVSQYKNPVVHNITAKLNQRRKRTETLDTPHDGPPGGTALSQSVSSIPDHHTRHTVPSQPDFPWYIDSYAATSWNSTKFMVNPSNNTYAGWWTYPYFWCETNNWQVSYTIPIRPPNLPSAENVSGLLSFDVHVTDLDINQCDQSWDVRGKREPLTLKQIPYFQSTHKCHNQTSQCNFTQGLGWVKGGYTCDCRPGYYSFQGNENNTFNGSFVELAWADMWFNSSTYELLYKCRPCSPGCHTCTDGSPCLSDYNWPFRISLLVISMVCAIFSLILIAAVFYYRHLKVFKATSPIFLCITLVGCAIMYSEMAAIFGVLDTSSCVATKWTRHLGFCVTYTALLMKTWRVSLTYRVKSAHKLKLTDRQLLQWLFPILLVTVVYLGAWTASAAPTAVEITDSDNLRFTQCSYGWWDHSLAIGELLFLLWGIKVCYSVRNAESVFNEAQHISWAVYNIAVVNIVMVAIHLIILPNVGPDAKYLFGFIRTQLSTTVTIALIFGDKFILVFKGLGDQFDNRARARGVTASFSLNGISVVNEEPPDLYRENEELKDELQKLASQMEFMKIVHMGINNPHIKLKTSGYFNPAHLPGATKDSNGPTSPVSTNNVRHVTFAGINSGNKSPSSEEAPLVTLHGEPNTSPTHESALAPTKNNKASSFNKSNSSSNKNKKEQGLSPSKKDALDPTTHSEFLGDHV